ncbi:MAG: hypothetical protein MJ058_08155 [Akkermansia sp.]|nr:hypothetical protein [Akkermansia sp.]
MTSTAPAATANKPFTGMRALCTTLLLIPFLAAPLPAREDAAQPAAPESHSDLARALTDFLSRTELCLRSCTDAASVQAAMPRLRELAQEARRLADAQDALPEPTTQDYMASQELALQFLPIWKAIRAHLERLEKDGLMTDELRRLLQTGPEG